MSPSISLRRQVYSKDPPDGGLCGEKSTQLYGPDEWFPEDLRCPGKEYSVSIKGPTTPVGGGSARSTWPCARSWTHTSASVRCNTSRACLAAEAARAGQYGDLPREHRGHLRGVEWAAQSDGAKKVIKFLTEEMVGAGRRSASRRPPASASDPSPSRAPPAWCAAIKYAIDNDRKSVTIVHKGNIMKFATEGLFRDTGLQGRQGGGSVPSPSMGPWCKFQNPKTGRDIVVGDHCHFLLQILLPGGWPSMTICHLQPQRRLHLRCPGGPGRRDRHCPGRQHFGPVRSLRGYPRYGTEVRWLTAGIWIHHPLPR